MPVFTIQAPDGRKIKIDAADQATALRGAQEWASANPSQQSMSVVPSGPMISVGGKQISVSDYMAMPEAQRTAIKDQITAANPNAPGMVRPDPLGTFAQGTTMGWGDEGRGVVQGALAAAQGGDFGKTYTQTVSDARGGIDAMRRTNPLGAAGLEVAGSIPTIVATAGMGGAATAGAPLWQTALKSAGVGAGYGGVYGAGSTNGGIGDRAMGAVGGAAIGGVVGGAVPYVAKGIGSAYQNILNRGSYNSAAKASGMSPGAARFLQETTAVDGATSPAGVARMSQAGPEAMLADSGQSAKNALDTAIQSSGKAGAVATQRIGDRLARDTQATNNILDSVLGKPVGIDTTTAGIRTASAPARSSAYRAAYSSPIDYSSPDGMALESLLKRVPGKQIADANLLMKVNGEKSSQILATIADDGSVTYKRMPDVTQLDYITRSLNLAAESGDGAGAMGGQTALGSSYQGLSREIRDTLKSAVPEYGKALETAADTISQTKAVKRGADLLLSKTSPEDVRAWTLSLTKPERDAMKQGIRSYLDEALGNVKRTALNGDVPSREALATLKALSSRSNREKLTLAIGGKEANKLFAEIDRIGKTFELVGSVANNSNTFMRQSMDRRMTDLTNPSGPIATLAKGEPVNAAKAGIQAITGMTPDRSLALKDQMYAEIADALTKSGADAYQIAQVLQRLGMVTGKTNATAQAIAQSGKNAAPAISYLSSQRALSAGRQ